MSYQPGHVVADRPAIAKIDFSECGGTEAIGPLFGRIPVVPFAQITESLNPELKNRLPSVFDLLLVTGAHRMRRVGSEVPLKQRVPVELELPRFGLEQRTEANLVPLAPIPGTLEFDDEADIDRILPWLGELELVFPLAGVKGNRSGAGLQEFRVHLREPVLRDAIAIAAAMTPISSAASRVSRNTMMVAPNMAAPIPRRSRRGRSWH